MNDNKLTAILREELRNNGYLHPEPYTWHKGEALYHGEPIQGRCTRGEISAVIEVLQYIEDQNHAGALQDTCCDGLDHYGSLS